MILGIDVGGTTVKYGLVDADGTIIERDVYETFDDKERFINDLGAAIKQYSGRYDAVGISMPGIVQAGGYLKTAGALTSMFDVNLIDAVAPFVDEGKNVIVLNDANAATIAEQWIGAAQGIGNYVLVAIGTGVGGGIVINGSIYEGAHGGAGEFGYMNMIGDQNDKQTTLSLTGATVLGLVRHYNELASIQDLDEVNDGRGVYDLAAEGDIVAIEALDWFYQFVAQNAINLMMALDPEVIVLGGGISANPDFLAGVRKKMAEIKEMNVAYHDVDFVEVVPADLRNDAGMIGAAYVAQQTL